MLFTSVTNYIRGMTAPSRDLPPGSLRTHGSGGNVIIQLKAPPYGKQKLEPDRVFDDLAKMRARRDYARILDKLSAPEVAAELKRLPREHKCQLGWGLCAAKQGLWSKATRAFRWLLDHFLDLLTPALYAVWDYILSVVDPESYEASHPPDLPTDEPYGRTESPEYVVQPESAHTVRVLPHPSVSSRLSALQDPSSLTALDWMQKCAKLNVKDAVGQAAYVQYCNMAVGKLGDPWAFENFDQASAGFQDIARRAQAQQAATTKVEKLGTFGLFNVMDPVSSVMLLADMQSFRSAAYRKALLNANAHLRAQMALATRQLLSSLGHKLLFRESRTFLACVKQVRREGPLALVALAAGSHGARALASSLPEAFLSIRFPIFGEILLPNPSFNRPVQLALALTRPFQGRSSLELSAASASLAVALPFIRPFVLRPVNSTLRSVYRPMRSLASVAFPSIVLPTTSEMATATERSTKRLSAKARSFVSDPARASVVSSVISLALISLGPWLSLVVLLAIVLLT
jgi:hypothetical protein